MPPPHCTLTPPHPPHPRLGAPELLLQQLHSSSLHIQHFRLHTIDPLNTQESRSVVVGLQQGFKTWAMSLSSALVSNCPLALKSRSQMASVADTAAIEAANGSNGSSAEPGTSYPLHMRVGPRLSPHQSKDFSVLFDISIQLTISVLHCLSYIPLAWTSILKVNVLGWKSGCSDISDMDFSSAFNSSPVFKGHLQVLWVL